ncbi:cadherin-related tumor suppressor-like [Schistocerca cancellata]|uniref:cadherin-related tumor suppressor-like n=1 Tax=Schistocerca cancellata TaxID=274614 RepID=UPI002117FA72|nr:cadherin-related tumor suppressor-like [Schistocerca cancellata]
MFVVATLRAAAAFPTSRLSVARRVAGAGGGAGPQRQPAGAGELRFSLLPPPPGAAAAAAAAADRFALDARSGALTLRAPLDREAADEYVLVVRLSDGVQHSDTAITVRVTDTNDNPPVFAEAAYSFDMPENAARGARVGEVHATDLDQGVNGHISYSVVSDWANDVFSLHPQTGVFTLTARLDYEEVAHYIFVVQAQDSGRPPLSSTVSVYFNVLDLNDNAPLFDPMSYSNEVFENITVGSPVLTVSATDLDSGENGHIEYSISAGDAAGDFAITANGTLVTARALDREARPLYNLLVTARDRGQPPLSSTVQVTVVLKDVNDAAPEFISPGEVSVAENTPAGTVVLAVKAADRDEGRNGYVEYSLVAGAGPGGDAARLFSVGATDGLVRVTGRLDRETRALYELWVEARDRGQPPLATRALLRVRVLDENDNSPVFDPRQYSASVAENASIGASVLQVSATDVDEGGNGVVRYAIVAGDDNRDFSIAADTGVVRVANNLNFERAPRYVLRVRATDSGRPARHDAATVAVAVRDINDNPPVFLDSPYLAYVMENVVPPAGGGYVLTVRAHDADSPPHNAQVRYFLKEGDADVFRVNATSGEVRVLRPLDREARAAYLLTLVAMDTGTPPLTGTGTVRVEVQDVNDHAPEFARQAYEASVGENLPAGTAVLRAAATDRDQGDNARLRYSLLGERAHRFSVNPDTGELTTAEPLDREETASYQLTLVAQDGSATEPRAAAVNVTVVVADANDNPPRFSAPRYTVYVPDSTGPGDFVFGAEAEDADAGANGQVRFSLSVSAPGAGAEAALLAVEAATGVVRAAGALPASGEVRATLTATDGGREPRTATAELVVRTRAAALFPALSLAPAQARVALAEDAPAGQPVARLAASSPKAGPAAAISYAVAGGNFGGALRVDASSGEVVVAGGGLDYETAASFSVWLEARDNDSPPLRSVVRLDVTVRDANDNAPVLERAVYNAEVPEERPPPVLVCRVHADDADTGVNGEVSYRLRPTESSALFSVDAVTGEVWTRARLDREQAGSHRLLVEAVDGGSPVLSGTATVLVAVRDENDNPPRFTRLFSVNVTENAELGSFVIRVTSSDRDVGENANASYSFADNPGERFAIDPVTGNVTVAGLLDREAQDEYLLKVAAVDGSWRAETPLTVTVQDQNDNAPEFEHSYYSFSVPETMTGSSTEGDIGSEVGASGQGQQQRRQSEAVFVGRVVATDRDKQGPNSVISYALQQPSDLFTVDPASGDIFSKRRLRYKHSASMDRSPENQYSFTVTATDNGKPPMSSECLVTVDVVDANNNSPEFETDTYFSPVPEKASVGLRIIKVTAHDDLDVGVNAEVEYVKTGAGNGSQFFQVARDTGWISVARAPGSAGVTYLLGVRARDHGVPPRHADVTVTVVVTPDNHHSPVFNTLSYQVIVPENEPVGSTIVTLSATDGDEGPNGMVRYTISSGSECEEFAVSAETGAVTIRQPLDYDSVPEYHLNITASDLAFEPRHATATLRVTLTDVNDNAPSFEHAEYSASVRENAPAGTAVFTLLAHDADSARYAVVRYSVVGGSGRDAFRLDPDTGVLYSRRPFDYEQTQLYTLDVLAANPDSPMYGSTKVVVHVTGENEFYPHFVQPVFHLDVSESAEVGTSVGTVRATDEDAGDDGHVFYLFVGASNDRGFSIVSTTGEIRVARRLDRETQSRAVLTVLAKNRGSIRGNDTDEAQVIISIQDGNDPPEFEREVYEAEVSEGAAPGALVATVRATDSDVRPHNNHFSYSIIAGNAQHAFKVDPATGVVETTSRLDREVTPAYALVLGAIDTGTPPQTGTATLRVRVTDINDNGPQLAADASRGYVSENEPAGTSVMTLTATDPDLPPNGAPFAYSVVGGRHRDLVSVERHSGLVRTTRPLDREATPELDIIVEVEDSGEPPMRSQLPVTVVVLDQNDSPSTPRAVHVLVYAFEGQLPHGKIADVRPNDADTTGDYHCEVQSGGGGLSIPAGTCELHALPSLSQLLTSGTGAGRGLALAVTGNDGVHADVVSAVTVELATFDEEAVANAVPLRAENTTAERFLAAHYKAAVDALRAAFPAPADAPLLFGLQQVDAGLEMAVAVRSQQGYRDRAAVTEALSRAAPLLPALSVAYSACRQRAPCQNGASCSEALRVRPNRTLVWDSRTLVFATPAVILEVDCRCTEGFAGERCDRRQDPCSPSPCLAGGTCHRSARLGDFSCSCPPLREGRLCELERGAVCGTRPCLHGGSCRESADGASFFCLCRPGFRGNRCEAAADSCRPNPCAHGGVCIALPPPPALGYRCSCPDGRFGRHCEGSAFGFGELAFAAFPSLDATTNDVSVVFATAKPDALLVYNYGAQTGGRSDFVSLELVAGRATFSYGGARTAIATVQAGGELADGRWHRITATRNGRVLSLSVASCGEDGDACRDCSPGDRSCSADEFGPTGTLNFDGSPMLVGGLPSVEAVLERPGQVHSDELVGCVHSVTVNGRALNLSSPLRARAVAPTCSRPRLSPCDSLGADGADRDRCGPAGRCAEGWPSRRCECHTGSVGSSPEWVLAPDCGPALAPVSLAAGARLDLPPGERHRRLQLLDTLYRGTTRWRRPPAPAPSAEQHRLTDRAVAFAFRTLRADAALFFAASNSDYTSIELRGGQLVYVSRLGGAPAVNTSAAGPPLSDGTWHHVRLCAQRRTLSLLLDGARAGDELDAAGVHDFLDPDLTALSLGGAPPHLLPGAPDFEGCLANFTINDELQPLNGSGSILPDVVWHGAVTPGCAGPAGLAATATPDPLSIGITLVIVFFVVLLVAILVSFVVFRLRRQKKEKGGGVSGGGIVGKQNGGATLVSGGGGPGGGGNDGSGGGCGVLGGRGLSAAETAAFLGETGEVLRPHHLVGPELIAKKYKEREIVAQRPDIIEREVVGKPLQPPLQPPQLSAPSSAPAPQPTSASVGPNDPDLPEHYDLENASSIAPSDIDIVYHYKGYREGGNVRKYRATPPHLPPPTVGVGYHHKHSASGSAAAQQQQHRHSPRGGFAPPQRDSPRQAAPPPPADSSPGAPGPGPGSVAAGSGAGGGPVLQSTPLARLSPSSELSAQQAPRILTLQDISGKPLQSALLATTSSSGGVGKDVLHSNSERSLNSPVMSQLSGQSSSASRKVSAVVGGSGVVGTGAGSVGSGAVVSGGGPVPEVGLTAEEIERLNSRPRTSSLVSTLDAVSSSSEAARGPSGPGGVGGATPLHRKEPLHLHHGVAGAVNGGGGPGVVGSPTQHGCNTDDNASSTTTDESGNDSFTCSEFEYDNTNDKTRGAGEVSATGADQGKPPLPPVPPASYDGFDSSFRGSLSTLVASDDDLSTHVGASLYRAHNGSPSSTAAALGWDYLLNWGPNFESLVGVFKDIAELPDSVNSRVAASLRLPNSAPKPSEEYV